MLMTTVAVVTARMAMLESRISQLAVERIRCRWAARAGVETARALLLSDERGSDTKLDIWAQNEADLVDVPLYGCRFTAKVIDESSKLNINTVSETALAYLPDMTQEILSSILDWRDEDEEIRAGGAESGYYLTLPNGYYCRNGALQTIRELLRVKGVTQDIFYGPSSPELAWSENEGWINYLTCHSAQPNIDRQGNPKIDINQAQRDELTSSLSFSRNEVQWILNNRPFQNLVSLTQGTSSSTAAASSASTTVRTGGSSGTSSGSSAGGSSAGSSSGQTGRQSGQSGQSGSSRQNSSAGSGQTQGASGRTGSAASEPGRTGSSGSPNQQSSRQSGTGTSGTSARTGQNRTAAGSATPARTSGQQTSAAAPSWQSVLANADQIGFSSQTVTAGKVNVNTAGLIVLTALLEGRRDLAENIITFREGRAAGFETLQDLAQVEGMTETVLRQIIDRVDVRSSVFSIQSTAVSDATGQKYTIEVILNRDEQNGRILYWREQ